MRCADQYLFDLAGEILVIIDQSCIRELFRVQHTAAVHLPQPIAGVASIYGPSFRFANPLHA